MRNMLECSVACAAAIVLATWSIESDAAGRTFVATTGTDANTSTNCGPTTPCRSFNAALSVTSAGGEIIVLNSGGYGAMTITQSVTVTAPEGVFAGITATAGGNGVVINGTGIQVELSGLTINSTVPPPTAGGIGIDILAAATVTIDRLLLQGMPNMGISALADASTQTTPLVLNVKNSTFLGNREEFWLVPNSATATVKATLRNVVMNGGDDYNQYGYNGVYVVDNDTVTIADSQITGYNNGIFVLSATAPASLVASNCLFNNGVWDIGANIGSTSGAASIELRNDVITGTSTTIQSLAGGVAVGTGATASLYSSTVTGNSVGVALSGSGVVYSYGNNQFRSNGSNVTGGTLTAISAQ